MRCPFFAALAVLAVANVVAPVAAISPGACSFYSPAGTDYADANITVTPAATNGDCCDACNSHNANVTATGKGTMCYIAVWHNVQPGLCSLKASGDKPFKGHLVIATLAPKPQPAFRFSSSFSSHMVLQQAPKRAVVWGFTRASEVSVALDGGSPLRAVVEKDGLAATGNIWRATLPPVAASFTAHTITASDSAGNNETLKDVLFGDVWVCSGQSNMAYSLNGSNGDGIVHPPVNDSLREIADMVNWEHIRLMRVGRTASASPLREALPTTDGGSMPAVQGWSTPCPAINGTRRCRVDFSNICWFYGRDIYAALEQAGQARPIGLIGSYVGGTKDELWSSHDALKQCLDPSKPINPGFSELWNGMIFPLINHTIAGAVWYQGEADSRNPGGQFDGYNCTFPAMIEDWRAKWYAGTGGETDEAFPFGFVQLNSVSNGTVYNNPVDPSRGDPLSPSFGYGGIRWAQSAGYGYAPNEAMPGVFMAVSVDTPDRPYPVPINGRPGGDAGFNVHSPFKQPTAARLARSGLAEAYGITMDTVGPVARSLSRAGQHLVLAISGVAGGILPVKPAARGFEILVGDEWQSVPIVAQTSDTVTIASPSEHAQGNKLRYNWYSNPCGEECFDCAVYVRVKPIGNLSGELDFLPLAPFIMDIPASVA